MVHPILGNPHIPCNEVPTAFRLDSLIWRGTYITGIAYSEPLVIAHNHVEITEAPA